MCSLSAGPLGAAAPVPRGSRGRAQAHAHANARARANAEARTQARTLDSTAALPHVPDGLRGIFLPTPPSFAGLAARTDAAQGINRQRRLKEEKRLTLPNACGKKDNTEASSGSGWMYKRCTLRAGSKLHPLMPENGEASVLPAGGAYLA